MLVSLQTASSLGALTGVAYWVIDRPRGAPWTARTGEVQAIDFGLDLEFESSVLGITWLQTKDAYALDIGGASAGSQHRTATSVSASHIAPWATLVGSPLLGVDLAGPLATGEPWLLRLRFGAGTAYVAAATPLPGEGRLLPGVDEVLVFNSNALAESYATSPHSA